jgi:hypothetical protein
MPILKAIAEWLAVIILGLASLLGIGLAVETFAKARR